MPISVFDHPWLSHLLGDAEIAGYFDCKAELEAMGCFEVALAQAQAKLGIISPDSAEAIEAALKQFQPDIAKMAAGTARDGIAVPEWISQLRAFIGPRFGGDVHFGATSQDVIDTSLVLRLKPILSLLDQRLAALDKGLAVLSDKIGELPLQSYTRMQPALTVTWADRIGNWKQPIGRHRQRLIEVGPRVLVVQLGGSAGTLERFGDRSQALVAAVSEALALGVPELPWHNARDNFAELASWLSLVSGSIGKIGQDVALLAQLGTIRLVNAGRSSSMAHKNNPVSAEILVSLARYNATQLSAMHQALVHEQERSGVAWTLEWMVLPQMLVATGAALRHCQEMISSLELR